MVIHKTARKVALVVFSCSVLSSAFVVSPIKSLADDATSEWGYGGAANPTHWGEMDDEFYQCEVGRDQSPINLDNAVDSSPANLKFDYQDTLLNVVNTGHTIQVNYQPGSTISIDGETYELIQLHFHTPSEHQIAEEAAPMELHLVHQNDAGELAVVGVMMAASEADNPVIDSIWQQIPEKNSQNIVEEQTINAINLLPENKTYFSYTGSLTTPPCSEGVSWMVLAEPIQVSERQVTAFTNLYQVNARPVQAVNGRQVELHRD